MDGLGVVYEADDNEDEEEVGSPLAGLRDDLEEKSPAKASRGTHREGASFKRESYLNGRGGDSEGVTQGKLFVGGLSWDSTEETITSYFERFGHVNEVALMKDKVSGHPRGFGFVTFDDSAGIQKRKIDGSPLFFTHLGKRRRASCLSLSPSVM
jgi:RNA recognition motif-containing protein